MSRIFFINLSVILVVSTLYADEYMFQRTNGPFGGYARSFDIYNDTLFLSGSSGVWYSPDSGDTWQFGGLASIKITKFLLANGLWLAASEGDGIFISKDRGGTWIRKTAGLENARTIHHLALIDTILVIGTRYSGIYRSLDWGDTCQQVNNGIDNRYVLGFASGDSTIVASAVGSSPGGLYISTDNAFSWHLTDNPGTDGWPHFSHLHRYKNVIYAFNDANNRVIISEKDGRTWRYPRFAGAVSGYVTTMTVNEYGIFVIADGKNISTSTDYGFSWSPVKINMGNTTITACGSDDSTLYVSTYLDLYRSSNGGKNWDKTNNTRIASSITYLKQYNDILFAATGGGGMFRSTDGETWQACNIGLKYLDIKKILIHKNSIYLSGIPIYKSDDLGDTWQQVGGNIRSPFCLASNGRFLFMGNYIDNQYGLYKSRNGVDWWRIFDANNRSIYAAACIDSTVLIATGGSPTIFYISHDEGYTWKMLEEFNFTSLYDILVHDSTFLILRGGISEVYSSTDRGLTWQNEWCSPSNSVVSAIARSNDTWYFGKKCGYLDTKYGRGLYIRPDSSMLCTNVSDSSFCMNITALEWYNGELYIGTDGGGVLKYVKVPQKEPVVPNKMFLYQNYPNPFNSNTTIRYDLTDRQFIKITIYDLLGRKITTLLSGMQDVGYKLVIWDGTNDKGQPVSAGVYFYQIRAGEYVQTKKMVVLK
ncbi:MAG: T9SS type A sorting domain-containing protein [Candidatus Neomarinimicrobiota bacterium]